MNNELPEPLTGWAGIRSEVNEVFGSPGYGWALGVITALSAVLIFLGLFA